MIRRSISNMSIKKKFFHIIAGLITVVLLTGIGLFIYIHAEQTRMIHNQEVLQNKADTINEMAVTLNDVFFRVRGYSLLKSSTELQQAYDSLDKLRDVLEDYSALKLSPEEASFREQLATFVDQYQKVTLLKAIGFVEQDDYTGLRALAAEGNTQAVNEFLVYTKQYNMRSDKLLSDMFDHSLKQANEITLLTFGLSTLLLLLFTLMIWRILKILIDPIVRLEEATNSLAAGEAVMIGKLHKQDEIGRLYEAFLNMAHSIQDKEEELMMQNEELHAQQDELQDQQFRLERSLSEIESMMKALDQSSAVAILSPKGIFTYANANMSEYTGYRNPELIGFTFRLLDLKNIEAARIQQIVGKLSTGSVWFDEVQLGMKNGTPVWLHMTIMPYLNDEGQVYQYILIANNITSMKNVQQKLAETLKNTEQTKIMLERSNQLNHDITYTLDKQEFAEKFIEFMNRQYAFDSSVFFLVKDQITVVKGVPKENVDRYLGSESGNMLYRMQTEKSYITRRPATLREQGIAPEPVLSYDYYSTVVNAQDEVLAVFCGTRIGHSFSDEEINEIQGMMNRVGLAIERLFMYEEIEHGRRLNRDIVNNVNEGIQFVQMDGGMLQMNQALAQLFDYHEWSEGDLIPLEGWSGHFTRMVNESEELEQFYQKAMSEHFIESSSMKYSIGKDPLKHVDMYALPVFRRKTRFGTLFVHRDITREYELDLMKSELVSTVSHELRTPLSSVLGFTELLLSKTMKPEKQLKYLETIHREAQRLTDLINDFLDLQRMESGSQQYNQQPLNLKELVMGVIDQYKVGGTHAFLFEDEAHNAEVEVDRDKIIQVMTNLLSNAIKFSPGASEIKVSLHNEAERIIVQIQDHGLGIPKNQIGQLFQKFRRVDNSASKRIGGTGLGLAICKEIIEKQKGSIGIESEEGEGSTVWFSLPVLHSPGSRHEDEPVKLSPGKDQKSNVMIVEDDYSLSLLLSEELKGKGFRVTHHFHPQQAFEQALKTPFVAIVVDLMLGEELDGWDLIRMLKDDERTEHVPIVISSALDKTDKNMMDNVEKYLTKPYPPNELTSTLQEIVNIRQGTGEVLFPDSEHTGEQD
ncbi:PAS domain S-box-containing protein [Paenibacillus sp. PastF-1]|nr:PAS domain S-box-containing protein [Paenibacillus sp. PastF-2]MDF9851453.1 PAS domain S-box-containing protein [Paenibacillus sp. PastM-2]MDF9858017.1 PAS domain S-box-containing protein [Paenibacillus sp. PastF-1]MDH6483285.1 PAS domain S-box-containing protein [Paenibacillus sp. PastH-2]MDH6510695.1 PAS domain S-box-containing protein [Paenibacillus sp. PastM-3]